jgi:hypothetical protein
MTTPSTAIILDPEHRRKLAELSAARGATDEDMIGELIDLAYDDVDTARRLTLVAEISRLDIEDAPDPATMSTQLAEAYGRPDLR